MSEKREVDTVQRVEELQIGASLKVSCQRGTDVRDDDTVSVDAHFETVEDLRAGSEELTEIVVERMRALRSFDPEADGDADG